MVRCTSTAKVLLNQCIKASVDLTIMYILHVLHQMPLWYVVRYRISLRIVYRTVHVRACLRLHVGANMYNYTRYDMYSYSY